MKFGYMTFFAETIFYIEHTISRIEFGLRGESTPS